MNYIILLSFSIYIYNRFINFKTDLQLFEKKRIR